MADRPQEADKIPLGELVCWWCGYGLEGVDLMKTDLRCPECGKENVPGNGPEAPHVRRPWPAWWVLGAQFCWPGLLLGLGVGLGWPDRIDAWHQFQAGFRATVIPAAAFSLLWPPAITELVVDERVSGMYKTRWRLGVAFGGIGANAAIAIVLAQVARSFLGG
jgi:hypothetical protein